MTALNPTAPRLDLMRAIDGRWVMNDVTRRAVHTGTGKYVNQQVGPLVEAGLVELRNVLYCLTDAGREWLAAHDEES